MNDTVRFIDQHAGRSDLFDGAAMHGRLAKRYGRAHRSAELNDLFADADRPEQTRQQPWLVAGRRGGLIDTRGAINAAEQTGRIVRSFRGAEKNKAARIEGIMEGAAHLLLQFAIEIDQHVAAGDQIDMRERRILEQIVDGEQDDVAHLLPNAVVIALSREEAA